MPASVQELHRRAQQHLKQRDYPALAACCEAILARRRDFADAWFLLSIAAEAAGDLGRARDLRTRAIDLAPGNAEYLTQLARLEARGGSSRRARSAAQAALAAGPRDALAFDTLGVVFTRLARYEEARAALAEAVRRAPGHAQYRFNYALVLQFLGLTAEAEAEFRAALVARPDFSRARWALSELRKSGDADDDLETLLGCWNTPGRSADDRLYLGHAIARAYEQRGDWEQAFSFLAAAKTDRRDRARASAPRDRACFAALRNSFRKADRVRRAVAGNGTPLFVVGMPRSGTTLVEQMLDSHPAVRSLGEVPDLAHAVHASAGGDSVGASLPDAALVAGALRAPAEQVAVSYRRRILERLGDAPTPRYLIDKTPLNALYIGFILRSLPAARIVLLRRDPRDVVLSNYRQLFAVGASHYDYHYDLETTARYVAGFEGLVTHWRALYGPRLFCLDYEALVGDPEQTLRRVFAYLDLPWDPACLAFHARRDAVATPSAQQVRRPVYGDAVDRWRRCERELAPAIACLAAAKVLPG